MRRKIAIIMVVGWMALIFFMSAQDADESSQMSLRVGHVVGEWFVPGYGEWTPERQDEFARSIELFVRKSAHAAEYAVLAALIANLLRCGAVRRLSGLPMKKEWLYAVLLTAAYAATDEVHQLFVPGRTGKATDVLIDTAGAAVGGILWCLYFFIKKCYNQTGRRKVT